MMAYFKREVTKEDVIDCYQKIKAKGNVKLASNSSTNGNYLKIDELNAVQVIVGPSGSSNVRDFVNIYTEYDNKCIGLVTGLPTTPERMEEYSLMYRVVPRYPSTKFQHEEKLIRRAADKHYLRTGWMGTYKAMQEKYDRLCRYLPRWIAIKFVK